MSRQEKKGEKKEEGTELVNEKEEQLERVWGAWIWEYEGSLTDVYVI